jgi:hypothetical protein
MGKIKRKFSIPNIAACTILSSLIKENHQIGSISGISCLGKQIKHNTKINQRIPGIKFL